LSQGQVRAQERPPRRLPDRAHHRADVVVHVQLTDERDHSCRRRLDLRLGLVGLQDVERLAAEQGNAAMRSAALAVLERVERPYPLDLDVAPGVFLAVLDRMPEAAAEGDPDVGLDDVVQLMADILKRGLLSGHPVAS
jgi:hypothetical protein